MTAEVLCHCHYKNKEEKVTLFLKPEQVEVYVYRWVIVITMVVIYTAIKLLKKTNSTVSRNRSTIFVKINDSQKLKV